MSFVIAGVTIDIGGVEVLWLAINGTAWVMTFMAIRNTIVARRRIIALNGRAREIVASGNVRREVVRFLSQTALLLLAAPAVLSARVIDLFSPPVLILISVSTFILINTVGDSRDRRHLVNIVDAEIAKDRRNALSRIEAQGLANAAAIAENTEISKAANEHADNAYREANAVNEKIRTQGEQILAQGEELAASREDLRTGREAAQRIEDTGEDTNVKVTELGGKETDA